ncbi:MAG TPA: IS256 family transposase [Mycobacteriales bacterium]|nr:IS256 family transposase [Mycobacteriales bacterium]
MTEVIDTAEVGRPRRDRDEPRLVDPEMVDRLIEDAREQGVDVAGEGGLFAQLAKTVMERSLAAELTDHLGYEEGDPAGQGTGNSRNGYTSKRLATEVGVLDLEVPRDRNGSFEPQTVRKGQRRREGIDSLVIGLYGRGLSLAGIQAQLKETFDLDVSRELLSKITDSVMEEVRDWQQRPLDTVYPVIFLDALVCKVRENGTVRNKAAHLAVGVDVNGRKEVLGIWIEATEGAKFWLRVMNELKARGVEDVLIIVCDGLPGLPAAVTAVWPQTIVQTCVVHLIRASLRWVNYKDRKRVTSQLKAIYGAASEQAAREALDAWTDSEIGQLYPAIKRQWENAWEHVIPFFAFAPEVRRVIYTTNMIESINYQLRKIIKTRGHLPNDDALIKLLYLGCKDIGRVGAPRGRASGGGHGSGGQGYAWKVALNQFDIMFPGRLDKA